MSSAPRTRTRTTGHGQCGPHLRRHDGATDPDGPVVWPPDGAQQVLAWGRRSPDLAVDLRASELGRPPEHLRAKYRRLEERGRAARVPGPRAEPARTTAANRGSRASTSSRCGRSPTRDVPARAGATGVRFIMNFLAGRLSDGQLAALRADLDVDYIEDNAIGYPR